MNNLSGPLPSVTRDCPLCNARNATDPSTGGSSGSALTIAPMRTGYGAPQASHVYQAPLGSLLWALAPAGVHRMRR